MGQDQDVLGTLAQRRDRDLEYVEAVIEVLAEALPRDGVGEVAVGRGDEAHIGLERAGPAQALELPLLEHPQELGLHHRAHLGDLVEEQRPSGGLLDAADLGRDRPGEGPFLVTEELRLEKLLRKRRAVDRDERLAGARRALVNQPGDDLLAGPRLAGDEHRGVRRGNAPDVA